ncbi:MAG: preprotein translocase subunit SecG [Syntrophus sp. (in: bacteria)]
MIIFLHITVCIALILVVLLQAGKGANMGAVFGGSSQTIFGSSGPGTFLGKVTTGIAVFFMLTSLVLSYMAGQKGSNLMKATGRPVAERQLPAAPASKPAVPQVPGVQQPFAAAPVPSGQGPAAAKTTGSSPTQKAPQSASQPVPAAPQPAVK